MATTLHTPDTDELVEAVHALREWQGDGALQLHPGDLGWHWRFGPEATAAAVRTWRRDGRPVAIGLRDGGTLLRLTTAPSARRDEALARALARDLDDPGAGVLGGGSVSVEAPSDALLHDVLDEHGWVADEPWTPLRRNLAHPVPAPGVRVETVGPPQVPSRVAVHLASFDRATFTEQRWQTMATGPAYADARCLLAYDDRGDAVAAVTVWSAGPGRPGLLEPMGVHRDHRGHGLGTAITLAGAAALQELGSSAALVCTPSANVGGVATYRAAGFEALPERWDRRRPH